MEKGFLQETTVAIALKRFHVVIASRILFKHFRFTKLNGPLFYTTYPNTRFSRVAHSAPSILSDVTPPALGEGDVLPIGTKQFGT